MRAPVGGTVSKVNGQWYNGGEFTPDSGLYCGKGSARLKKDELDAISAKLDMEGKRVEWIEKENAWAVFKTVTFSCGVVGEQRFLTIYTAASLRKLVG